MSGSILFFNDVFETARYSVNVKGAYISNTIMDHSTRQVKTKLTYAEYESHVAFSMLDRLKSDPDFDPDDLAMQDADVERRYRELKSMFPRASGREQLKDAIQNYFFSIAKRRNDLTVKALLLFRYDRPLSYEMYVQACAISKVTNDLIDKSLHYSKAIH